MILAILSPVRTTLAGTLDAAAILLLLCLGTYLAVGVSLGVVALLRRVPRRITRAIGIAALLAALLVARPLVLYRCPGDHTVWCTWFGVCYCDVLP